MYNKFVLWGASYGVHLDKPNPMKGQNMENVKLKYDFKPLYITSDGYPFWVQKDGTMYDAPNPKDSDLSYNSLDQFFYFDPDSRKGSVSDHAWYASRRLDVRYYDDPKDEQADIELVLWYKGTL